MAAAAEERSNHPLALAVIDAAKARGLEWRPAEDAQVLPGRGLTARVEGHDCLLGNEMLFGENGIALPAEVAPPEPGVTRLWMALDGAVAGILTRAMRCGRMRRMRLLSCGVRDFAC
jgi:P-type Cu+ transporter